MLPTEYLPTSVTENPRSRTPHYRRDLGHAGKEMFGPQSPLGIRIELSAPYFVAVAAYIFNIQIQP